MALRPRHGIKMDRQKLNEKEGKKYSVALRKLAAKPDLALRLVGL